ncbi:molybdopterin cofactor sulfurase, putative [Eimeria necatrix]|uniref:Molybdopterin cofactor sulfurase, putative n=1 Tax=Eimeria necatrix TaxID=51315 RepID=U6MT38_9EIME|nr:molybdopterin cofactor sulfurase, putative [Eimeria necatrix]CDJ65609.1 molybdopterin cofactor sulfurase, putative [Eimeria necatrix]
MRRQGLACACGIALLTVVLAGARASDAAAAGVLAATDDQPCSCSGETPAAAGVTVAATQPPPSISGLSPEGVYFIPEPLPTEETQEACLKQQEQQSKPDQLQQQEEQQQTQGPLCSVVDSQGWEHPSSYTASIVFAPVRATHAKPPQEGPHIELPASESSKIAAKERVREGPKTADERVPAAAHSPRPESPDTLPEHIEGVFSAAQKEVQQLLAADSEKSSSKREREHHPESLCRRGRAPTHAERRQQFLLQFGEDYSLKAEETAQKQLRRLKGDIYLDYAGAAPYQEQQLLSVFKDLGLHAFGNAHSRNPSAKLTDERTREARELTLKFFGAEESDFAVVFTSGATAAIKLVGEDFPFSGKSSFFYLRINHNSVLGVRELAYAAGVEAVRALSEREVNSILAEREKEGLKTDWSDSSSHPYCLFGFPLKDNFNGTSYPVGWIEKIHKFGLSDGCRWLVLLDAAAAAPTTRIQLSGNGLEKAADFLAVSFYKVFGYPTGLGALVLKRSAADVLKKVYWGGGSVSGSLCDARWQKPKKDISARLEDGTVNFLSIAAIKYGFAALQAIGMDQIERHVASLTRHLYRSLKSLRHRNGAPFVLLYWGRTEEPSGGIVNFNLLKPDGSFIPFGEVEARTAAAGIHLRTGCFCNPGGCQDFLGLTGAEIVNATRVRESCSDPSGAVLVRPSSDFGWIGSGPRIHSKAVGSVRISLGYLSTFADVDGLVDFLVHAFLWQ